MPKVKNRTLWLFSAALPLLSLTKDTMSFSFATAPSVMTITMGMLAAPPAGAARIAA